jgi:signal peptidase I
MIFELPVTLLIFLAATGAILALDYAYLARVRERRAQVLAREGKAEAASQARTRPPAVDVARFCFPIALIVYLLLKLDFALVMLILLVVTGAVWALDRVLWAKSRPLRAQALERANKSDEAAEALREPVMVEYSRAFFPVILIVFVIRSFGVEPFRIPSGSMMPNLLNGDFILVNKFSYGIRLPVLNMKIMDTSSPKRGDVVVFRFPPDPSTNFIKRLVGLPGDRVEYKKGVLTINGVRMDQGDARPYYSPYPSELPGEHVRATENLDGVQHDILGATRGPSILFVEDFPMRENCTYSGADVTCTVPAGHYFMMGDNRDNSRDSRAWGFVPDRNLVGRAFLIWFSVDTVTQDKPLWQRIVWSRIGDSIH